MKNRFIKLIHFNAALFIIAAALILPMTAGYSSFISAAKLIPVGRTTGIKLSSEGPVITGFSKDIINAKEYGLECGDVIIALNGEKTPTVRAFSDAMKTLNEEKTQIIILRNGEEMTFNVKATFENGEYLLGVMLRDTLAGIGTITFIDPKTGKYGALGHSINDPDISSSTQYKNGNLMPSKVLSVKKGVEGEPGELMGSFDNSVDQGSVTANTESGVFGKIKDINGFSGSKIYDTASLNEIKPGKAFIISNISGTESKIYDIEILNVFKNAENNRQMLIRVTDQRLLEKTGGIVQGMSGSPVIQNGKLIGAVTHVLINDPSKGYAIGIDSMIDELSAA